VHHKGWNLDLAVKAIERWGFHYRGVAFVWVKTSGSGKIIHGQGVRPSLIKPTTEFLLWGSTCAKGRPFKLSTEGMGQVLNVEIKFHGINVEVLIRP
jgi:N6-adenosine-specific RNA methylase IME4